MPQGTTRTRLAIGLQHRRRQRIEHQHGLGLLQRPAQLLVIFRRADPGQRALDLVQRPGMMPALGQAAVADLGRGELVARALPDAGPVRRPAAAGY